MNIGEIKSEFSKRIASEVKPSTDQFALICKFAFEAIDKAGGAGDIEEKAWQLNLALVTGLAASDHHAASGDVPEIIDIAGLAVAKWAQEQLDGENGG